jgi:hypothetical protein
MAISGGGLSGYSQDRPTEQITWRGVLDVIKAILMLPVVLAVIWIVMPMLWLFGLIDWSLVKEIFFDR